MRPSRRVRRTLTRARLLLRRARQRPVTAALAIILLGIALLALPVLLRTPRGDRLWADEFARTTTAALNADGTVSFRNMRDWSYGDGRVRTEDWISTLTVNPGDIVKVWFILEPFAEWKAVGHTFLSFELTDGSAYAFSVEARREQGERYSTVKGLFREYELTYTWGTERDLITRRLLYLKHPLRMYPLAVSPQAAQTLFRGLIQKSNDLAAHPRFYNTIGANCTNMLATLVNQISPGTVPLDITWYLPGHSDEFLMRIGLIKTDMSVTQTQAAYDLTPKRAQVLEIAQSPHAAFGTALRRIP